MVEVFANSGDPDQMLCCVASDLGLQFAKYPLGVPRLQWIKGLLQFIQVFIIKEKCQYYLV